MSDKKYSPFIDNTYITKEQEIICGICGAIFFAFAIFCFVCIFCCL